LREAVPSAVHNRVDAVGVLQIGQSRYVLDAKADSRGTAQFGTP
jgi:hypothetical protein